MKHHLKQSWQWDDESKVHYFCAKQGCTTVYFNADGKQIKQGELRLTVGIKSDNENALICYCFDVSRKDAGNPNIKAYVTAQTKANQCACSVRNPSGRCCLKDLLA